MDRYVGLQTAVPLLLHRGFYVAIIMDRYVGPRTALTNYCMKASK
jgi:hypothetical protein